MAGQVDMRQMAEDYIRYVRKRQDVETVNCDLRHLQLEVEEPIWENIPTVITEEDPATNSATVTFSNMVPQTQTAQMVSYHEVTMLKTVEIQKGLCKDFNKTVSLKLPVNLSRNLLGGQNANMNIDLGKKVNKEERPLNIAVNNTQSDVRCGENVTARVTMTYHHYEGKFSLNLIPVGKILIEVVNREGKPEFTELDMQECIQELNKRQQNSVAMFQKDQRGTKYSWCIEGYAEFRWQFDHNVEWIKT